MDPVFWRSSYEEALCVELSLSKIDYQRQMPISLFYQRKFIGQHRLDLFIDNKLVIELKAVKNLEEIHYATTLSYLKASKAPVALLLNFSRPRVEIKRFANTLFKIER